MATLEFKSNDRPSIGVELELGLDDAETMALSSAIEKVLPLLPVTDEHVFKPELMQCQLEIITGVCQKVADAEKDLRQKVTLVEETLDGLGLRL